MELPAACLPDAGLPVHRRYPDDDCPHKSSYRGLTWDKRCCAWRVRIALGGKQFHVGRFTCELEAARAFDRAALCLYGEAAKTNFGLAAAKADPLPTSSHILGVRANLAAAAAAATAVGGGGRGGGSHPSLLAAHIAASQALPSGLPRAGVALDAWRCRQDLGPAALPHPQGPGGMSVPPPSSGGVTCCMVGPLGLTPHGMASSPGQQSPVCPPLNDSQQQQYHPHHLHHQQQQQQPQLQLQWALHHPGMYQGQLHSTAPMLMQPALHQQPTAPPPSFNNANQVPMQQLQQLGLTAGGPPPTCAVAAASAGALEGMAYMAVPLGQEGWSLPPATTWCQVSPGLSVPQGLAGAAGLAPPGLPCLLPSTSAASAAWATAGAAQGGLVGPAPPASPCLAPPLSSGAALMDQAAAQRLAQAMLAANRNGLLTPHTRVTDLLRLCDGCVWQP